MSASPIEQSKFIFQNCLYSNKVPESAAPCEQIDDESDYEDCIDECGTLTVLPEVDNSRYRKLQVIGPHDPKRLYLCVGPGLNIQAKCMNQSCPQAFQKKVWIHKKFGIFRIHELKYELQCPVCNLSIDSDTLSNIGFTKTKVVFNGVKIKNNIKEKVVDYTEEEKNGKFLTYMDRPECQVKWGYLTIEALPL